MESCYSGGSIFGAIFGTIVAIAFLAVLAWWIYKRYYCKNRKDPKLMPDEDPENAKHEFAFDNPAFKGDGNKTSSPLNTNWTTPKIPQQNQQANHDKRKPLDDSYAGTPAPRLVSLKGSDFTGLGIECYGGLKDGIFVKKVAPQGPASGYINVGDRITSLTIDFQHIVQEDAMTILSYASPYNVQLELMNGNNKLISSGSSMKDGSTSPGRQSPLVHPLVRSSSQSDLNTIERNSRKKLFNNDTKDYPTLKMDKNAEQSNNSIMIEAHPSNNGAEKKSPSLMQQFRNQIAKIEEKFQNRSSSKMQSENDMEEGGMTSEIGKDDQPQTKKGMKFGIKVFPNAMNEIFNKARSKSPSPPAREKTTQQRDNNGEVKVNIDDVDGTTTRAEITIENENFNRQGSVTSSGIKRDANGIPQELPAYMANAANAARDGRKMMTMMNGNEETRKSKAKAKAPRPPMTTVDLNESTETMDTNLNMTDSSMINMTANNTNNTNMEIEDELDRITEKYLSQSKDKLNFTDTFNSSMLNKIADESIDKIEDLKEDIDDVILRRKEPSNSSTPKSDRKDFSGVLDTSDLDLSTTNYSNRMELNSSDVTVHQPNEGDTNGEDSRRAASLGDLSLMKKSLTERDGTSMERAQSLDITDNNNGGGGGGHMMGKPSLAMALSKPTTDLTTINGDSDSDEMKSPIDDTNKTDHAKMMKSDDEIPNDTNVPDDIKVTRFPFGSLERPKSDVLKKILGTQPTTQQQNELVKTAPSIVLMTSTTATNNGDASSPPVTSEIVPMTNGNQKSSIVKIEKELDAKKTILSVDTTTPVSLTLVNNSIPMNGDPNHMSPVFSSNDKGINSIKISSVDFKPIIIKNNGESHFTENYIVKDNVVTISTDSQPSSIQFIDEVKLDFNMQVLYDLEREDKMMLNIPTSEDFKPKIIEAEIKVASSEHHDDKMKVNGNGIMLTTTESNNDLEINNNISKTAIIHGDSEEIMMSSQTMNKFLSEIVFKGSDDSAIEDMTTSEDTATLTSSTVSESSSSESSSSTNVVTSMKKTNVPLSTANFIKNERRQIEKNFVPQNQDIKFTTSYENNSHQPREPQKRMSQIEQIRQNFEKSSQGATEIPAPIPVARKSSIPLSTQKNNGSPSKIPVFKTNSSSSSSASKISPKSRTNSTTRLNTSNADSVS